MSKHTKGPWRAVRMDRNNIQIQSGKSTQVANIEHPHWDEKAEADAILIKEAPNMLKALQKVYKQCGKNLCTSCRAEVFSALKQAGYEPK